MNQTLATSPDLALSLGEPVPDHLKSMLAPARRVLQEWVTYPLWVPYADQLRIGTQVIDAETRDELDGTPRSYFRVEFQNQLGRSRIVPLREGEPCGDPIGVEVIAGKFPTIDHSVRFLESTLADLFARVSAAPFEISAPTGRGIRDAYAAPNNLFAFHFFRHHHEEIVRAAQAILGNPHRALSAEPELVRIHQVRHLDRETLHHMLQTSIQRGGASGVPRTGTALQILQPDRVLQRPPVETHDTPENRFIVTAARRMLATLDRVERAPWFRLAAIPAGDRQRLRIVSQHLREMTTDPRLSMLDPSVRLPAQSRVLQRRDGYRELTLLWNALHRTREPIFEAMEHAIDLRDIATLYEYWVLFALIDEIESATGENAVISRPFDDLGRPAGTFEARFPGYGTLSYQRGFSWPNTYSGITLRPDYVWQTTDGRRIVLDAKFRLRNPKPHEDEDETPETRDGSRAKTDDIAKMHAYRDAIAGVTAAIVLYPGDETTFRPTTGDPHAITIADIITGDLNGIGWMAMRPVQLSQNPEGVEE